MMVFPIKRTSSNEVRLKGDDAELEAPTWLDLTWQVDSGDRHLGSLIISDVLLRVRKYLENRDGLFILVIATIIIIVVVVVVIIIIIF